MYYVIFGLLGAALLGADQWVKAWVMGHLQMGETTSLFPGFLELMRVHNYGAAWSSFAGQKWLLLGVTGVILAVVLWAISSTGSGWAMWWICSASSSGPAIPRSTWRMCASCPGLFWARSTMCYSMKSMTGGKRMEPLILQTASEDAGKRLDAWLAEQTELTRSAVQKLMEEGRVTAAGKPLAKNTRLTGGETVSVELPEPEAVDIVPQNIPLDVVYEDEDVIVVNKPKGLVVHPAPGHPDGTLVNALLYHCGDSLSGINGELRPGIVHRIDRDTSGLIIAAKNDFAHVKLAEQLQDHTLARTYRCIVTGNLREDTGTVNAPIGRCPTDRKKMAVVAGGRNAVTHWTVLERYPGVNYVECRLETGRTHQIRVHMAYIGHPILGDTVYGNKKPVPGLQGQCLHAVGLKFIHPRTGELVELTCGLPEEFEKQLKKYRNMA